MTNPATMPPSIASRMALSALGVPVGELFASPLTSENWETRMRKPLYRQCQFLDDLYTTFGRIGEPCAYCGAPSDSYDHVPPLAFVGRMPERDQIHCRLRKLPACVECNSALGSRLITNVKERRKVIREHLRKKYAHLLRIPQWSDEELAQLSTEGASEIRRYVRAANYVRARLNFYSADVEASP